MNVDGTKKGRYFQRAREMRERENWEDDYEYNEDMD